MESVANHLWQSALTAGAACFVAWFLGRESASVRYWVWFAASVKFLLPFEWLVFLGSRIDWKPPAISMPPPIEAVIAPFPVVASHSMAPVAKASNGSWDIWTLLTCIWVIGMAVSLLRLGIYWAVLRIRVRRGTVGTFPLPVEVRLLDGPIEPSVFGVFRPVLVLPSGIEQRLTGEQLSMVVEHEMTHVRRRDNLTAAIHLVVEAIFWFFPVVWWIRRQLVAERERACDESVLRQGHSRHAYAEAIICVCRAYTEASMLCAGAGNSSLRNRIESILHAVPPAPLGAMKRNVLLCAAAACGVIPFTVGLANAPAAAAQVTLAAVPKFEVISVRPCGDRPQRMRRAAESPSPGRLDVACDVLTDEHHIGLIQRAYVRFAGARVNPFSVIPIRGGPGWIRTEQFEIHAKAEGQPAQAMILGPMLQTLLEERFKLKIRRQVEQGAVYELTQLRSGSKAKASAPGACVPMPPALPFPSLAPKQRFCLARIGIAADQPQSVEAESSSAADFAKLLATSAGRPVIDKTGLQGLFDFKVEFSGAMEGPSLFTAIQEQLGLRLTAARGLVEVLVIDHVERPSPN